LKGRKSNCLKINIYFRRKKLQTKTVLKKVAKAVRNQRLTKGQSVTKLASLRKCGVSERTIRRIENSNGVQYNPTLDTLVKLANGLNVSVDNLIGQLRD
jgi:transcriptional regulator with XRE-family HTH domain